VEVLQRRTQLHRSRCHIALLCLALFDKSQLRKLQQCTASRASVSCATYFAYIQVGSTLNRSAIARLHAQTVLQGTRSAHDVSRHWRLALLKFGLFRRKRRTVYQVHVDSAYILVSHVIRCSICFNIICLFVCLKVGKYNHDNGRSSLNQTSNLSTYVLLTIGHLGRLW
jgi:hypothetical protein